MLRTAGLLATLALVISACSQSPADVAAPTLEPQFGTPELDGSDDVAVDSEGRVYVIGTTNGDLARPNLGESDAFVRRYAPGDRASVVWQRQFGTDRLDGAHGVATGLGGDIYVVGQTSGSLAAPNPSLSEDAFVRKYAQNGKVVWTRQFGGSGTESADAVATDPQGSVYLAGKVSTGTGYDAFVRKYRADGTLLWHKQLGTAPNDDRALGVAVTGGGVYVSGYAISFSGGQEQFAGFLRKLSTGGAERWARTINLSGDEIAWDVAAGRGVYVTGSVTIKNGDFSDEDVFLRKYDETGRVLWTRQFGSEASDSGVSVSEDAFGDVYLAGRTLGVLADFSSGSADAYMQKYTSGGRLVWTRQFQVSTSDYDAATGVASYAGDPIYLVGGTSFFDSTAGQDPSDAFITQLDYNGDLVWRN